MRTNIEIDDALMQKAIRASKAETKTKRAVVEEALRMLVRIRAQEDLRDLFGKIEFHEGYDYKAMRADSPNDATRKTLRKNERSRPTANSIRSSRKRAA